MADHYSVGTRSHPRLRRMMNRISPLQAFRRYWWVCLLFALAGAALGAIPEPQSTVDTQLRYRAFYAMLITTDDPNGMYAGGIVTQLSIFATLGEVPKRVAVDLERPEEDGPQLASEIEVNVDIATASMTIATTQDSPEAAEALVNSFGEQLTTFIAERQDDQRVDRLANLQTRLDGLKAKLEELKAQQSAAPDDPVIAAELNAASNQYTIYAQQFDSVSNDTATLTLTELQRGNAASVRESSGLQAPTSRRARGFLGFILGGLIGAAVAMVLGRLDRRIRSREHAEAVFGGGSSTDIPLVSTRSDRLDVVTDRHDQLSDAYRTLRSVVSFSQAADDDDSARTRITLVVSACAGDGKTSVAANLAAAFAETGKRVVVVNGDFRRPAVSKRLLEHPPAVLPYSLDDLATTPLLSLLQRTSTQNIALFDLSSVKASPGNLARATSRLMPDIVEMSDAVVIDSSPVGLTAEVLDLLPLADTVVMVIRLGHTLSATAQRTLEMLHGLSTAHIHLALMADVAGQQPYYEYGGQSRKKPVKAGA